MSALPIPDFQRTGGTFPRPRVRKDPARTLVALLGLQAFASTSTSVSAPSHADWPVVIRDPSATGVWVGEISVVKTAPEVLDEIKHVSGLTWEQLGRIMGVSRRSIHLWLQGKPLNQANEERLHAIRQIIRSLGGRSQLEVRSRLLDKSGGASVVDLLAAGDDKAAAALAHQRALTQGAPTLFEHTNARSRGIVDARRGAMTALDLLETSEPPQIVAGKPKGVRRIKRRAAEGN